MRRTGWSADTALVFGCALALFATTATAFEARVTDLSALRTLNGEVPYRDFWTMYAPGSFTTLALAFALFGRELLVSNLLGIATSAVGVAAYYRLAMPVCGAVVAWFLAALVTAAFLGTGYHDGFTSYPPAFLLIAAAVGLVARRCAEGGTRWAVAAGLLLGLATLFKHDIGGYATIACGAALIVARRRRRINPVVAPTLVVFAVVAATLAIAGGVLIALGAGPDLWTDLVRFPLTDFRHVRGEDFPIVPRLQASLIGSARELTRWSMFNLPLVALLAGVVGLRRQWRGVEAGHLFIAVFALAVFPLHWIAAHVQMNTNAISLVAWGALAGAAGWRSVVRQNRSRIPLALTAVMALWATVFLAEPGYRLARRVAGGTEWLDLPQLRGITATHADAAWMRGLAAAIAQAGDPEAPLLFLSNRNDVDPFAESTPYWLTNRRPATRHHELHPGITDTLPVQRQMLAQLEAGPRPVVVREHRFSDDELDAAEARIRQHVPIGSSLIDEWVATQYEEGPRFGMYEVMRRRSTPPALVGRDPAER